jgi:putative FmdB family regulatory protein
MPLYEYTCRNCDYEFETLVPTAAAEKNVTCPKCEGVKVQRRWGLPAKPTAQSAATACDPAGPSCGAPWCKKR